MPSNAELLAQIKDMEETNAALKLKLEGMRASNGHRPSMKVSEKGALSVYGLMRFPVTLYKDTWLKVLGMADEIRAFITAHPELTSKDKDK